VNKKVFNLKEGHLLVLPRDCIRKGYTFPEQLMHCFSIDFYLRNTKNKQIVPPFPILSKPGRHEDIVHLLHELTFAWIGKRSGYMIKCKGLFLQIFHRFMELIVYQNEPYAGDFRITKIIRYIDMHYAENITVRDMSKILGLNTTYFGVLFSQTMGMSLSKYLMQTRVRNAENLLNSGEYKVSNVAEACGFADTSHFYKQFKRVKGYPPSHSLPKKF